tara:strand:+ start:2784 stop:3659 length:876 start_codon:yes stop_codon:yes gene_type:complete
MGLFQGTQQAYYTTAASFGNYQTISLADLINNFEIAYIGEGKVIPKQKRSNIVFFAKRALQELSYDTFKSEKSQEIEIPPSLIMTLPHDYVNYVKLSWSDNSGVERLIYPASKTSNPTSLMQDSSYNYVFDAGNNLTKATDSDSWAKFKGNSSTANDDTSSNASDSLGANGGRFGIDPVHAQSNGVFYIDTLKNRIHFSADIANKTVSLKYISDSLATDDEMKVHKLAEEAVYKYIAHAILASSSNVQEYLVQRFKKEKFAAVRNAKLRLSNIKIEELTQAMRGKSKQIKH